jgi:hypothetical protein
VRLLLLLLALQSQDPVRVQARLQESEIAAGETVVLRVDVETDGDRARIDPFRTLPPGLELQSTRTFDQRQFSLPGGTRRFISREFVLRARAPGRYRIPSVQVVVGVQMYETESQLLTVTAAARGPASGGSVPGEEGVALRAWLSADTVFAGEQVTFNAEAMFSQDARLRLRRAPEYEPPSPSGFWIQDLPDRRNPTSRSVGGRVYEVQRFRRALFPLTPGVYEIPPARLEYEIRRGLLYAPETRQALSDTLRLVVLPVPEPGPEGYTGAVGRYSVNAALEPSRVPAGEAAVLDVEIEGEGNLKALPPPALPTLEGVEVFPPSEESETDVQGTAVRGRKRFSWVLIPRQAGTLDVPGIRYPYFDPAAGQFDVAGSDPLTLTVTAGGSAETMSSAPTVRYLKPRPGAGDPLGWVSAPWFLGLQAVPLFLLAGALGMGRRRGVTRASAGSLRRRRRQGLRELEERVPETDPGLFADAQSFARQWLADRLGLDPREAARPSALAAAGVSDETARRLRGLIDRLAAARYAPTPPGPEARRDLVRALGTLLERIDREAPAPGRAGPRAATGRTTGAVMLVALAGLGSPVAVTARQAPATPEAASPTAAFEDGRTAFDQERFADAADAFDQYVRLRPRDPAGWYNLGTAYYHAGHDGYAVWAWLHVPRLDPRDEDTRHNLRTAGAPPELVARVAPPLPLRASELLLAGSVAWILAGALGAWGIARRGRRRLVAAGVAFLFALGLAGAGWASTRDARTVIVLDEATLRAGPALRADPVTRLEPGTGLIPVDQDGDWIRGRTLRGAEGWIEATATGAL